MAKLNDLTGLTLTRNGSTFVLKWKNNDDYWNVFGKIIFKSQGNSGWPGWGSVAYQGVPYPTQDTTEWNISFPTSSFYPHTTRTTGGIGVGVEGRNPYYDSSNLSTVFFDIHTCPASALSLSYATDTQEANKTIFTIGFKQDLTAHWIVSDLEYESVLKKDCNEKDGSQIDWSTSDYGQERLRGTMSAVESQTIEIVDNFNWTGYYSATRWFRVRARGPAGASPWVYTSKVNAIPAPVNNPSGLVTLNSDGGGYLVTVNWDGYSSPAHPIDYAVPEYAVVKPQTTLTTKTINNVTYKHVDLVEPTNPSWTQGTRVYLYGGHVHISQVLDRHLADDEAIIVRGTHYHKSIKNVSAAAYAEGGFGYLASPSNITMSSINPTTHRCTVGATNNSQVANTFLAVYYRTSEEPDGNTCIGIIPPGSSSVTVIFPDVGSSTAVSVGVQAYLADYAPITPAETGVTKYSIANVIMKSSGQVWTDSSIPLPPSNVALTSPSKGTIRVSWDWSWIEATEAELSWADREDAWESTTAPSTYNVSNINSGAWNIVGLEVKTWYVRVRLLKILEDKTIYGGYSNIYKLNLAGPPYKPSIELSNTVITEDGTVTCYWDYISSDGTDQSEAEICEANISNAGVITYGTIIGHTNTSRHLDINAKDNSWHYGERHYLAVRVTSESGEKSEWSAPEAIVVAEEVVATITSTSLVEHTRTIDGVATKFYDLTEMPLTVTASGCGANGTMTYIIERNANYNIIRPDGSDLEGYEGEAVYIETFNTSGTITINQSDLLGYLDDGAEYRLIVIAKDTYGQTAEKEIVFTVKWNHQAVIPGATVETEEDRLAVCITPFIPTTYIRSKDTSVVSGKTYYTLTSSSSSGPRYTAVQSPSGNPSQQAYFEVYDGTGDSCDIYRLSADKPVLIFEKAQFGTKYVDPYPTLGEFGGHRVVYRTANGDYITENNRIAWKDTTASDGDIINKFATIIDFDGDRIVLPYNLSVSNKWDKDFTETKYLGGSVQGDWNPAVSRTGSIKTTVIVGEDPDTVRLIRKLAAYPGICHVRTPEGSSYSANVVVTDDREEKWVNRLSKVSLEITRIDDTGFDGKRYSDWHYSS